MLPLLFITYLILEYWERKESLESQKKLLSLKWLAPFCGALLGIIPQCGFSLVAAGLYVDRAISLGTLLAVFISTSDEAIPILLAYPKQANTLLWVILIKLGLAWLVGYTTDLCYRRKRGERMNTSRQRSCTCHHHEHSLWQDAFFRTMKIFFFLFVISFALSALMHFMEAEHAHLWLLEHRMLQPFIAALFGFIPNCASSVVLAQLFANGVLSFGSLIAGLTTNAGLGLMVLIKTAQDKKEIGWIMLILLIAAWSCGTLLQISIG